ADRKKITNEEYAEAASARWIPGERDEQHRRRGEEYGVDQRLQVARAGNGHEREAAQDHDHEQQHQEHAVEKIDDLRAFPRFGLRGEERDQYERDRKRVLRYSGGFSGNLVPR